VFEYKDNGRFTVSVRLEVVSGYLY